MSVKELRIQFDMDDEVDQRVYQAIYNLPDFYKELDISKALIRFINNLVATVGECEERTARCETLLAMLVGDQPDGHKAWN